MISVLLFENIAQAFNSLFSNKMRALLTMLGIIIGIASVIAIETVGNSLTNSFTDEMEGMGANNITVGIQQRPAKEETSDSGYTFKGTERRRSVTNEDLITDAMIADFYSTFKDEIKAINVSRAISGGLATSNGRTANLNVIGENSSSYEALDLELLSGHVIDDIAYAKGKSVGMISDYAAKKLFGSDFLETALGQTIEISFGNKFYSFMIIGVYEYEENGFSMESGDNKTTDLYVPIRAVLNKTHKAGYTSFTVVSSNPENSDDFMKDISSFFDKYYHKNEFYEVTAMSMKSLIGTLTSLLDKISLAISIIAGISLLVGGIGVMNIMLVSISERTREIGTRKALGATNGSIRTQFIVESVVMCLVGGVIGIIIGVLGGSFAADKLGYAASPSVKSILVSVFFSLAIGVFFGFYPANKAAKMNPIDALRYE